MKDFDENLTQKILISLNEKFGLFAQFGFEKAQDELIILGNGGFSTVYEMYNRERTELKYALKVTGFNHQTADPKAFEDTNRLWWLLSQDTDHIVRILETKDIRVSFNEDYTVAGYADSGDKNEPDKHSLHLQFVLMERLESVIVKDRFRNVSLKRPELNKDEEIISFALEIGQALLISHTFKVLHRDVKLENIFWDDKNKIYKLGDFGLAKYAMDGNAETVIYTDGYGAPEIERRLYNSYDETADIYSFGITLYLLLNDLKFPGSDGYYPNVGAQYDPDFVFPAPAHASERMTGLIRRMCSYEPKDRYQSVADVLDALKAIVIEDNTPLREELIQMTDMATVTYRETEKHNKPDTDREQETKRKTRAQKKEVQELRDFIYQVTSVWHFVTLTVLLVLLFGGGAKAEMSSDILLWTVTAAVIFEAIFQKIDDLEIIFGIFTLVLVGISVYFIGFTFIHLIFIICILAGQSLFSFTSGISAIIWIVLSLIGKADFAGWISKHDLCWIIFGLFLIKLFGFMYLKDACNRTSIFRADKEEVVRNLIYPVMIGIGLILLLLKRIGLIRMPVFIELLHPVRTGIFGFIGTAVSIWFSDLLVYSEAHNEQSMED